MCVCCALILNRDCGVVAGPGIAGSGHKILLILKDVNHHPLVAPISLWLTLMWWW